ncbi:MAG: enoyl-CoA hydratase/isomerase family protein [Dethiobacteria bacterium]
MSYEAIILEKEGNIATVKFNNPAKKNMLTEQMKNELKDVIYKFKDDDTVRVVVLTGSEDSFCAGGDLSTMGDKMDLIQGRNRMINLQEWFVQLVKLEKPVIASINGHAVGAGFSLALASDVILASERAIFGAPFNRVGVIPDYGCLYFLPRYVGLLKAKELVYTGKFVKAEEAKELGFVNEVVPHEQLAEVTKKWAQRLARGPAVAIGLAKNMLNITYESSLKTILDYEILSQTIALQTNDHREGVSAFFDKREPNFQGR